MKRRFSIVFTATMLVATVTAFAQNVHLKGGANAQPAVNDLGVVLEAAGALAGLGNGDVLVTLTAHANVTSTCTNQGGNEAPGQNPAPITVSGSQAIPASEVKNGTTPFDVKTVAPVTIIPGAPDCPNTNWTEQITDLSFTSAVITVEQPFGNLVLTVFVHVRPGDIEWRGAAGVGKLLEQLVLRVQGEATGFRRDLSFSCGVIVDPPSTETTSV